MDGVLLIDKPGGPTSHDVVARLRRTSGEKSIGHTGTLDPRATGLLPLVLGRATRLASYLTAGDKTYDATFRLGFATDTDDADGRQVGEVARALPGQAAVLAALAGFSGTFDQTPPSHSAKKVAGRKAYELARRDEPVELKAVPVTIRELTHGPLVGDLVEVRVTATAGFYVRALARDLGARLGCGAHLTTLRRTRSGAFDVAQAIPLEEAERLGPDVCARLLSPADALPDLATVQPNEAGLRRVRHGNSLSPEHLEGRWVPPPTSLAPVRVLSASGELIALARSRGGALHPIVVLG
jgi:tRNA pseudouridine55 synthase